MPIMHRGDLPDPRITAIRDRYTMPASTTIDTGVYIDIHIEAPDCQLYFTTDGSVPAPFKRWMGNREVTFRYLAPFALKSGKRVVRAVAVSRDGLLQSRVVSKTFKVIGDDYDSYDSDTYLDDDWSDAYVDSDVEYFRRRKALTTLSGRRSYSPSRPRSSGDSGWIACTRRYPYNVETVGDLHRGGSICWSEVGYVKNKREIQPLLGPRFLTGLSIPPIIPGPKSTCGGHLRAACGPRRQLALSPTATWYRHAARPQYSLDC